MASVSANIDLKDGQPSQEILAVLQRLRGYIRLYVLAEGLGVAIVYLALWFWLGMLLDYGFFRAFAIDWVQELPRWFRSGLLAALSTGFLALMGALLVRRLIRGLRNQALALLLERRFPAILGDRLITAVELSSPRQRNTYRYSSELVEQTIREAVERTAQIPVESVFDWTRLRKLLWTCLALTALLWVCVGIIYCAYQHASLGTFLGRFEDTASLWFERNILLRDTIWPRRSHLVLLNAEFQNRDAMYVGRDAPPPALRIRALKWVIADSNRRRAPEGWRALRWHDVNADLLGNPAIGVPALSAWRERLIDDIEFDLEQGKKTGLRGEDVEQLKALLRRLQERAAEPGMSRRLRELEIPQEVTVYYHGVNSRSEQGLQRLIGHEYSGAVDLKETVQFTVRGNDYFTPTKHIIVVPPPSLVELTIDEAQPAYLYHPIPIDGTIADLRGKKQRFKGRQVSLTGDTSRIDVPSGTDLVLTAKSDKPLQKPLGLSLQSPRNGVPEVHGQIEQPDDRNFRIRFDHVTAPLDFVVRIVDTTGVAGLRHLVIQPVEDVAPQVDVQVEVVRHTNQGYLVTAQAAIPFSGKVHDDHGLTKVEYAYVLDRVETPAEVGSRYTLPATLVSSLPHGLADVLGGLAEMQLSGHMPSEDRSIRHAPLGTFEQFRRDHLPTESVAQLDRNLNQVPPRSLIKDFAMDPEQESFAVDQLGLKLGDERTMQPRYQMHVWVTATDNNIESGPRTGQSRDKFTVLIVSENELLAEIAKEEETLRMKLEEAISRLKDVRIKVARIGQELPDLKPDEFSPMARRSEEAADAIVKSWDSTREIYADYTRILKELRANRVQAGMITKVNDKICEPLDGAINLEFVQSDEGIHILQKKLEAKERDAQAVNDEVQRIDRLVQRLTTVLDAMTDVTNINKIIEMLMKIEKGETDEYTRLQKLLKQKQDEMLEDLTEPKTPDK